MLLFIIMRAGTRQIHRETRGTQDVDPCHFRAVLTEFFLYASDIVSRLLLLAFSHPTSQTATCRRNGAARAASAKGARSAAPQRRRNTMPKARGRKRPSEAGAPASQINRITRRPASS